MLVGQNERKCEFSFFFGIYFLFCILNGISHSLPMALDDQGSPSKPLMPLASYRSGNSQGRVIGWEIALCCLLRTFKMELCGMASAYLAHLRYRKY